MRSTDTAVAWLLGALCAAAANPTVAAVASPLPGAVSGNAAVRSLLETAEQEIVGGRPQQASTLLERALRIEPNNPAVWHYLGRARLELGDYSQAAAMASKSHSLNADDRALRVGNAELLSSALQSSGRAATDSERQILAAPTRFDFSLERARRYVGELGWEQPAQESVRQAQAAVQRAQSAALRAEAAARRAEQAYRRYYRSQSNQGISRRRQY